MSCVYAFIRAVNNQNYKCDSSQLWLAMDSSQLIVINHEGNSFRLIKINQNS